MPRISAGLLMYRIKDGSIQVLLAHLGGPFFVNKDEGSWSIPKGEPDADEDLLVTAQANATSCGPESQHSGHLWGLKNACR